MSYLHCCLILVRLALRHRTQEVCYALVSFAVHQGPVDLGFPVNGTGCDKASLQNVRDEMVTSVENFRCRN